MIDNRFLVDCFSMQEAAGRSRPMMGEDAGGDEAGAVRGGVTGEVG
jgi:hypothetical protein